MANGNWDFYIKQTTLMQAIEAYQEMANTLAREKIEIIQASDKVLRDWRGNAAHSTCYNIRNMLAKGIYYRSCREIGIMRRCLEESLPWIGEILKRSEEFTDQLENDDYVELHMSADDYDNVPIRNGGVLCINYSKVETITQYCDKVAELTDKVTQKLINVVDDCEYLLGGVCETLEGIQAAARKLHRIENYKKALMIFAKTTGYVEDFIQEQMYAITGEEDYVGEAEILSNDKLDKEKYTVSALVCTAEGDYADQLTWEQMLENANYIYAYLSGKGWTTEAICGLLGNIYVESKMNPGVWRNYNNMSTAYGIVQWNEGKFFKEYEDIINSADDVNRLAENDPQKLLDIELLFLGKTMCTGGGEWIIKGTQAYYDRLQPNCDKSVTRSSGEEFIKSTEDPGDLALIFHACYERSGNDKKVLQQRADAADTWYTYFANDQVISLKDLP